MLFPKKIISLLSALFITGCGFTPLYQQREKSFHHVKIATIPDREGQVLKNELLVLFPQNNKGSKTYYLEPVITFDQQNLGLRRDATSKRQTLRAHISFTLIDQALGTAVYKDRIVISGGYNVASSTEISAISLVASEKDTRERILQQGAQEIKVLVESFLNTL